MRFNSQSNRWQVETVEMIPVSSAHGRVPGRRHSSPMFAALCRNAGKAGFLALALAVLPCAAGAADGDESWDTQFTETNAPNGLVGALAFSGTNLYVGGDFTNAGGVSVNRIAMWDGHQWTALGSGVSGPVLAIAIQDTHLSIVGDFDSVNIGTGSI